MHRVLPPRIRIRMSILMAPSDLSQEGAAAAHLVDARDPAHLIKSVNETIETIKIVPHMRMRMRISGSSNFIILRISSSSEEDAGMKPFHHHHQECSGASDDDEITRRRNSRGRQ